MKKISLFATIFVAFFAFGVMNVDAKEIVVNDEAELKQAVTDAVSGDVIVLNTSIDVTGAITVENKEITIDGTENHYTLYGNRDATGTVTDNITLVTAVNEGAIVHLKNVNLYDSPKYGIQAYNGGYVSIDNVTIENCKYGAILVNAGTVEIINLSLGKNGEPNNKGIEISKSINLADSDKQPNIIMNGTINSALDEGVIYFADDANDGTTGFVIENSETTSDKILVNGETAVITDSNNEVKYTSNEAKEGTVIEGEEYTPNIEVTDPEPTTPETPVEEVSNEENPETSDGILLFLGLTAVGIAGSVLTYRRLHN